MENKNLKSVRKEYNLKFFLSVVVVFAIFYFLLPKLLNFPKYFDDISFQIETIKIPLVFYFVLAGVIFYILQLIIDKILMKRINKFINFGNPERDKKFIIDVRDDCMNYPYKFMVIHILFIVVLSALLVGFFILFGRLSIKNFDKMYISLIRLGLILISVLLILIICKYYFFQKYLNTVLKESYENYRFYKKNNLTISNSLSIVMQILLMSISIFIIFINFSYSNTVDVYSKSISTYYRAYMEEIEYDKENINIDEILSNMRLNIPLWDTNNTLFLIDGEGKIHTLDSKNDNLSDFMMKYKDKYFFYYTDENGKTGIDLTKTDNVIYESYGIDEHAYLRLIKDEFGRSYYIGVKYFAGNLDAFKFLAFTSLIILLIYTVVLIYWARNNSMNIKNVEKKMKDILSDKDILKKNFMPVLSNDEIGNISYYYNKIQDKLLIQRDIMFKQEQLSVLGELAGGMAHDINTPISSINTSILMLNKYCTTDKEKELLENMQISSDRIINIVTSMRNQIRNLGSNDKELFSLNRMVDDLHVLTQNEQKKSGCVFESEIKEEIEIYGEKTKLGQVLTNIVVNGIQAYSGAGKKGTVKLTAFKKGSNTCRIEIEDKAGGIPEKVQKYLFKNIMTTKGAKGTGLGMYLAGSVIKGIYQGDIWFEVEKDVGTKFIIEIPMKEEKSSE